VRVELQPILDGINSAGALGVGAILVWALMTGQLFAKSHVDELRRQLDAAIAERDRLRESDAEHHRATSRRR
jgi:hypothetical protein